MQATTLFATRTKGVKVQRIVDIVARMTDASRLAVAPRDLARLTCQILVDAFPAASAVVLKVIPGEPLARVVAGVNLPSAWQSAPVALADLPLVETSLKAPERVFEATQTALHGATPADWVTQRVQTLCAAIPTTGDAAYVLILRAPFLPRESAVREVALDTARRLLASTAVLGDTGRWPALDAIHRAKLEWEHTADALPEILGLLDRKLRVVRISRAVEHWQLGEPRAAIGRDLHGMLHPQCTLPECALQTALDKAFLALKRDAQASVEIQDPLLGKDVVVLLKAPSGAGALDARLRSRRTVFSVTNITSLRDAERELKVLNQSLEQRVAERTAELVSMNRLLRGEINKRRDTEKSLQQSKRELELLSDRLMSAQEEERKRISADLHDSVGQNLSAIKYSLERAQLLARRDATPEGSAKAAAIVDLAIGRVQRLMEEVRAISMNLRPALLDDLGAASAVRGLCRDWQGVYTDIDVQVDISVADQEIPKALATNVFRAVQESLNNVARHALARHVEVAMHLRGATLAVTVSDDGVGFPMSGTGAPNIRTRGLRGLQERAESTGGRCEVASFPGRGTTVRLEWPLAAGTKPGMASALVN